MRNLPLLLALLLLSVLLAATSAQASLLPLPDQAQPFLAADEEEGESEEDEGETEVAEESGTCTIEDEEDVQLCAEIAREERESAEAEECVLEGASATVVANPGKRRLRLTLRYRTLKPSAVTVTASLRGAKGSLLLGTDQARFHRSGVYRDTFTLAEKQVKKALGAREVNVDLHAVNTPPSCRVHVTARRGGGARKLSWS